MKYFKIEAVCNKASETFIVRAKDKQGAEEEFNTMLSKNSRILMGLNGYKYIAPATEVVIKKVSLLTD